MTREVVDEAKTSARGAIRQSRVQRLGTDKRLLYEIIRNAGRLSAGDLHDRYEREAQSAVARSTRRKYLSRLAEYGLIGSEGSGRGKEYVYPNK